MTLTLLIFSPNPLAAQSQSLPTHEPQGNFGEGHRALHDFYKDLTQPGGAASCCSDQDCRPTQWRVGTKANQVKIEGKWCDVPQDKILPMSAPDGQAHICTTPPMFGGDPCNVTIFCVIIGTGT